MRHKQFYDNSCGASSLLCAAGELGVRQLPNIPGSMCLGQVLAAGNNCESAIYQLSCGATTGKTPIGTALRQAGYSLPHDLVFAARLLGLDAWVFIEPGLMSTSLAWLYGDCLRKCEGSGVKISRRAPPPLRPLERRLRIVGVMKILALHYVLERPQSPCFMDPGDGADYQTFGDMNNSILKSYLDTGITILLRRTATPLGAVVHRQAARDLARHQTGQSKEAPF